MADFIDDQIAYPSAQEMAAEKYNRLARPSRTRLTVPADKPFAILGLLTTVVGNNTQRRNTETAIDNLTGVDQAKILTYGTTPVAADVPVGYHVEAIVEIRFRIEPDA
jgi:hypothetical protein